MNDNPDEDYQYQLWKDQNDIDEAACALKEPEPSQAAPHYFTADLHVGHKHILRLDGRPWDSIHEHDNAMSLNMVPQTQDKNRSPQLWILGDVGYRADHVKRLMASLRPHWAKIHLVRGNHDDKAAWKLRDLFDTAQEAFYLRVAPDLRFYLSHYAHRVWRNSHYGSYHLHGHSHGGLAKWGRSMDVGCMLHNYKPVSIGEVEKAVGNGEAMNHHPQHKS